MTQFRDLAHPVSSKSLHQYIYSSGIDQFEKRPGPVPALQELHGTHQRSKNRGDCRKSEEGDPINPTLISYLVSEEKII